MREKNAILWSILLMLTLLPPLDAKRGGFSIGRTMGRSSTNRGASYGGVNRGRAGPAPPPYQRNPPPRNDGYRPHQPSGGNWNNMNNNGGGFQSSRYTSGTGIGSKLRSNTFKNAIVGAAAGYLTYQAGKAIIRAAAGPMMWNNRPYYWGSNYYPRTSQSNMCRMPIEQGDQQFGNVYFQDQTRPREIVWSCGYYEHCCGYECCRGGSASNWRPSFGQSLGYTFTLLYTLRYYLF
ncbi:unnamed protein product [Auanema sp. JU1783]|nr:unnamed protein product [Auanema sp. JU1783]